MNNKVFLTKLSDGFYKKTGEILEFIFSYNSKVLFGLKKALLVVDFNVEKDKLYFKIVGGVGYQYRQKNRSIIKSEYVDRIVKLIHPYITILKNIGQAIYINKEYCFKPDILGDIFPFLSYENKMDQSELLVRFTGKCNQRCEFCSSPIIEEEPDIDVIKKIILNLQKKNRFQVTITGGEPTIRKEFPDFVKWTLKHTRAPIIRIQTNAVLFANKQLLKNLPKSKKIQFFISLHSLEEDTYDMITSSKGQLTKAIDGIKSILKAGYDVIVNVVINKYNYNRMDEYLRNLYNIFGRNIPVHFSVLILPDYRKNLEKYIVSYKDIAKNILPLMEKYHIPIESFINSTHASIPLCYLPERIKISIKKDYLVSPAEFSYNDFSKGYIKLRKCKVCSYNRVCLGIPSLYYRVIGKE